MDEIVRQAMAKWPNVPHCYGWLMLDARGAWRMRTEQAQAANLPGDRIAHEALLAFINRNYLCDDRGRWYFQNGPQRVYVNLEATPFIAQTDATGRFRLQTGDTLESIDAGWFTETGRLVLEAGGRPALLDDRDLAACLPALRRDGMPVDDARLLDWIDGKDEGSLALLYNGRAVPIGRLEADAVERRFGFIRLPQPDGEAPA